MARIAVGGVQHETNTFAPEPTSFEAFEQCAYIGGIKRGDDVLALAPGPMPIGGFVARANALGHRLRPFLYAFAEPGGTIGRPCFERLTGELIDRLKAVLPVDAVYLDLHGAMTAEDLDDGDAELLWRVRSVIGSTPLVCTFDLHGNLTDETLQPADIAIAYRTYPHVDAAETGARAADLVHRLLAGGKRPKRAFRKLPFLVPLDRQSTFHEPARSIYGRLTDIEASPGVWAASLMMGFLQSDLPFVGPSAFAYADTGSQAREAVERLCAAVEAEEASFRSALLSPDEAAAQAAAWTAERPLVIADVQDNAGGGASSDTVDMLEALLRHRVRDAAIAMIHDPAAVDAAFAAGVGATLQLSIGGKGTPGDRPFEGTFLVRGLNRQPVTTTGPMARGQVVDLGHTACLAIEGVEIVVASKRTQCLDQAYFTHLGIVPSLKHVLVVKSSNHFRADFERIAGKVIGVAGKGLCTANPADIPYTRLRKDVRLFGGGPTLAG